LFLIFVCIKKQGKIINFSLLNEIKLIFALLKIEKSKLTSDEIGFYLRFVATMSCLQVTSTVAQDAHNRKFFYY
jgi:hypothetical protein